jgi:hypothetical protein
VADPRPHDAERIVASIEREVQARGIELPPVPDDQAIEVVERSETTYRELARVLLQDYRTRTFLGLLLMLSQSFLYNVGRRGGRRGDKEHGAPQQGKHPGRVFAGYGVAAAVMVVAGIAEFVRGVDAERQSLEHVAASLSLSRRQYLAGEGVASGTTGGLTWHVRRTRRS